jgi:hypothetical protein
MTELDMKAQERHGSVEGRQAPVGVPRSPQNGSGAAPNDNGVCISAEPFAVSSCEVIYTTRALADTLYQSAGCAWTAEGIPPMGGERS